MKILKSLTNWHKANCLRAELYALDNHLLDDIGINRSDIPRISKSIYPHL